MVVDRNSPEFKLMIKAVEVFITLSLPEDYGFEIITSMLCPNCPEHGNCLGETMAIQIREQQTDKEAVSPAPGIPGDCLVSGDGDIRGKA